MLQRVLSFVEEKLPPFLEKLSASLQRLTAWAGWQRTPVVDNSVNAEARALTKSLTQQRSRVNVAAASLGRVASAVRPPAAERRGPVPAKTSTRFSITIRSNGQEHTYDTTSGISDELASKLMDELGLPPEEFQTLLRLRQHRLQDAAATPFKKAGALTRCPICGNQSAMTGTCPKCGSGRGIRAN
jgi:hypothetical protein